MIALTPWIPCREERLGGDEPGNHILSRKKLNVLALEEMGHGMGMGAGQHPWEKSQGLDLCCMTR